MPSDGGSDSSLYQFQVGAQLKQILETERDRLRLSLAAFCSRLGVTEETYRRLGSGRNAVRAVNASTLKNMLNGAIRAGFSSETVESLKRTVSRVWLDAEFRGGRICSNVHEHISAALEVSEMGPSEAMASK